MAAMSSEVESPTTYIMAMLVGVWDGNTLHTTLSILKNSHVRYLRRVTGP